MHSLVCLFNFVWLCSLSHPYPLWSVMLLYCIVEAGWCLALAAFSFLYPSCELGETIVKVRKLVCWEKYNLLSERNRRKESNNAKAVTHQLPQEVCLYPDGLWVIATPQKLFLPFSLLSMMLYVAEDPFSQLGSGVPALFPFSF